jgi:hypothetical protein
VYSLGRNTTPCISFKLVKSRIKNIRRFKQRSLDVKWRGLDSTVLLKSALYFTAELSFIPRSVANVLYHLADFFLIQIVLETRLRKTIVAKAA